MARATLRSHRMPLAWDIVCLLLAVGWVALALVAVLANRKHASRFEPTGFPPPDYFPPVTLITPIKGIDRDLTGCIQSLCTQEYPDYRVIIVLESRDDPAFPVVSAELSKYPQRRSQVMIAGAAGPDEGQKVHNQLHVLRAIEPDADDNHVWAFADSDAVPGSTWLATLVGRLKLETVGVTTGYRWIVPENSSGWPGLESTEAPVGRDALHNRCGPSDSLEQGEPFRGIRRASCPSHPGTVLTRFWSSLASVINASVACAYRTHSRDQAWGGAMAMHVRTARQGQLIHRLTGALTDDYPITRMARDLNLDVRYLPQCLAATPVDFTFASLFAFARRQYIITRVYSPAIYAFALMSLTCWLLGFAAAWSHLIVNVLADPRDWRSWLCAPAIAAVFVLNQLRAGYRRRTISHAFGPAMLHRLRLALFIDRWLTPVWMSLHWLFAASALVARTFTWRSIRYRLDGPNQVKRLG